MSDLTAGGFDGEASASNGRGKHGGQLRRHVLLVCPPLFSYHLAIKAELEGLGFEVTWWNDRSRSGPLYKMGLRLWPGAFTRSSAARFLERLKTLEDVRDVLIVKGEGLSASVLKGIRQRFPSARLSLYLWDSVDNTGGATALAPLCDAVSTFDPIDAASFGWLHRPLFARAPSAASASTDREARFDWSFIGTLHSDRHRVVEQFRHSAPRRRCFVFGYVPSRLLLAARFVTDPSLWRAPPGTVSTRAMTAAAVAAIAGSSQAILDIEHPRQRGLTMRTIETLVSGKKLITTNRHVTDSDLFDPSRVHVIARDRPSVPDAFFANRFEPIDSEIAARYSLRQWLFDVMPSLANSDRT